MSGILILCATEFEMSGFLKKFPQASKKVLKSGAVLYAGPAWHCLITGPGVFNTAMGLGAYLEHHTPKVILDTGIAGVFAPCGLALGDIAVATQDEYLHTGVGSAPFLRSSLPFELILDCPDTRHGLYRFESELVCFWQTRMEKRMDDSQACIAQGPFLTVSGITSNKDQARMLYEQSPFIMESMEGAAAAHTATCYGIPMVEIRAASNRVGEGDKQLWNFDLACEGVKNICLAALADSFTAIDENFKRKNL